MTFNRLCASGLNAVNMAARAIKAGEGDVYIAGGVESMSRGPYAVPKSPTGWPVGNVTAWDSSFGWRFPNPRLEAMFPLEAMGETAENIYEQAEPKITREEQDAFAYESQRRAVESINTGRFTDEIAPVSIPQRKGDSVIVAHDEHPRYHWEGEHGRAGNVAASSWQSCARSSAPGGRSRRATPAASTTARRPCC